MKGYTCAFALWLAGTAAASAYSTTANPRSTGAPGDQSCAQAACHTGTALNAGGGKVEISFPSGLKYLPGGGKLRLQIVITDPMAQVFGFQATARLASNLAAGQAGRWDSADANTFVACEDGSVRQSSGCRSAAPLEFIQQSGPRSSGTFALDWTPPLTNVGDIRIYVAAVAANGNGQNSGDKVYTASYTLSSSINAVPPSGFAFNTFSLPFAGATAISALGVNGSGTVAGSYRSSDGVTHGFLRDIAGVTTVVDAPGAASYTVLTGLNDAGQAAGNSDAGAFLRNADGTFAPRPIPGGIATTGAVNKLGQMAGAYLGFGAQWSAAGNLDLFELPATWGGVKGLSLTSAYINDSGQIAGSYLAYEGVLGVAYPYFRDTAGTLSQVSVNAPSLGTLTVSGFDNDGHIAYESGMVGDLAGTQAYVQVPGAIGTARIGGMGLNGWIVGTYQASSQGPTLAFLGQPCSATIGSTSITMSETGGTGQIAVSARPDCTWVARAVDAAVSTSSSGTGNGTVNYTVMANSGSNTARTLRINVAGQIFTITQAGASCGVSLVAAATVMAANGGTSGFSVTAPDGCNWSAVSSNPDWLLVTSGSSGSGNGTVRFLSAANPGATRAGSILIGGQTFYVNQAGGSACSFVLAAVSPNPMPAGGGSGSLSVTTPSSCYWAASSNSSWLTLTSPGSANGNGTVTFTASATTQARTGTLTVAGQAVSITQPTPAAQCAALGAMQLSASGGQMALPFVAQPGCSWQITSSVPWAVVSPSSGVGQVDIAFGLQPNPSTMPRSFSLTINNSVTTFTQPGRALCTVALAPSGVTADSNGGSYSIAVGGESGCAWSASTSTSWITLNGSVNGSGNGVVSLTAAGNGTAAARFGTVTIGDQMLAVVQKSSTQTSGTRFVPITPCRIADTRGEGGKTGPFGPPFLTGSRDFPVALSSCGVPGTARAYSLNVTVVPYGPLGYLTAWPQGQAQPLASNLNSPTGTVLANAVIVPAGAGGGVSLFASNPTEAIIDVNGYFVDNTNAAALAFYPLTPCRVMDTRSNGAGAMPVGNVTRTVAVRSSGCGVPVSAAAYSMNFTVVPQGKLGYLATWPANSPQPVVSTLNSWDGAVLANAAIVPAGADGAIQVFTASERGPTDVILDINGYFAPAGSGALSFFPAAPCRAVDTRTSEGKTGAFGPPAMQNNETRAFPLASSTCGLPSAAQAYAMNVTVVPTGGLGYLSIWPAGVAQPVVSTLNSWDGRIVANAALVPAGTSGSVSLFTNLAAGKTSDVILDVFGYFAP